MNKKLINWWIGGNSYTSEYQAVLDRATALGYTLPSNSTKTAQNQLVVDLKAAGIWSILDVFYVAMANDANLQNFSLLNWITPASYQQTIVGSPTYGTGGFTGDGSTGYLNTNYNPTTNAVNLSLDNASYFMWCNSNTAGTEAKLQMGGGISGGYRVGLSIRQDATNTYSRCHTSSDSATANAGAGISNALGLWQVKRTSSAGYDLYQSGTLKATITATSTARPTTFEFLCVRNNLTATLFTNKIYSMGGAGSGAIDASSLYTCWNTYKTAIGL